MCGDCTDPVQVARLLDGKRATLAITSPPYNVGRSFRQPAGSPSRAKYATFSDDLPQADYVELLVRSSTNALNISEYVVFNLQMLAANKVAMLEWLYAMRMHVADVAVWDKGAATPAMCRNVMNAHFELLVFLTKTNPTRAIRTANFRGTVNNVYHGSGRRGNPYFKVHAATFPLHLPSWLLSTFDASGPGLVYDPFCGTGTTMIATDQFGRTCYAMEIKPSYCELVTSRSEALGSDVAAVQHVLASQRIYQEALLNVAVILFRKCT